MGNASKIVYLRCREQEESQPHFIPFRKLSKIALDVITELIDLNYSFNIPLTTRELLLNSIMVYS